MTNNNVRFKYTPNGFRSVDVQVFLQEQMVTINMPILTIRIYREKTMGTHQYTFSLLNQQNTDILLPSIGYYLNEGEAIRGAWAQFCFALTQEDPTQNE